MNARKLRFFAMLLVIGGMLLIFTVLDADQPALAGAANRPDLTESARVAAGSPLGFGFLISDPAITHAGPNVANTDAPAVAFTHCDWNPVFDAYYTVWYNDRAGNDDIYGQMLHSDGSKFGVARAIAAGTGFERRYPDVTHNCNTNQFFVVWEQEDFSGVEIYGRFLDGLGGEPLNPIFTLKNSPALVNQYKPKVAHAYNSGVYLVVWESYSQGNIHGGDIVGQLVANDGTLIGSNFTIAAADANFSHTNPDVAYNRKNNQGDEFLVVWQRQDKTATPAPLEDIYGYIIGADGSVKSGLIEIARYTRSSLNPAVAAISTASANGRYLVAWELDYAAGDRDIYARIVYGDGNTAPSDTKIVTGNRDQYGPAVAGSEDGQEFLVTWHDAASSGIILPVIKGQTLDPEGVKSGSEQNFGGFFTSNGAVESGPLGDYLLVYNDTYLDPGGDSREVFGHLWGNRLYLPLLER